MLSASNARRVALSALLAGGLAVPALAQTDFARACTSSMAVSADPSVPSLDRRAAEAACACASGRAQAPSAGVSGAALDAFGARLAAGAVAPDSLSASEQEAGLAASLALVACALDAGLRQFAQAKIGAPIPGPDRWTIAPAPPPDVNAEKPLVSVAAAAAEEAVAEGAEAAAETSDDAPAAAEAKRDPLAIRTGNGTGPVYSRQASKGAVVRIVR